MIVFDMLLPDDYQVCPVGCAMLMFSVFRIRLGLLKKGGVLNSPENLQFWHIARPLLLRRQPPDIENVTLVARRREYFRGFGLIFFVAQLPPKRGV